MLFFLLALAFTAHAKSIENCLDSNAVMTNVQISVSPDPPKPGKSFLIKMSGQLNSQVTKGEINGDLEVKVAGQTIPAKFDTPFTLKPGILSGLQSFSMGPFTLPRLPLGIKPVVSGKLTVTNGSGKGVICVNLDLPLMSAEPEEPVALPGGPIPDFRKLEEKVGGVTNCGSSSDHLKDLQVGTFNGITYVNGTLDEAVSKGELKADIKVSLMATDWQKKLMAFSGMSPEISFDIKIDSPFDYEPGLAKGLLAATFGPAKTESKDLGKFAPGASGKVQLLDGNGQEIVCLEGSS